MQRTQLIFPVTPAQQAPSHVPGQGRLPMLLIVFGVCTVRPQPRPVSSRSTLCAYCLYQSTGTQNKDLHVQTLITLSSPEASAQA